MEHLVTRVTKHQSNPTVKLTYPYILVDNAGDALAIVMQSLEPGEIPILIIHEGTLYNVGSVRKSCLELAKLLQVYKFSIHLSKDEVYKINTTQDIMESGVW